MSEDQTTTEVDETTDDQAPDNPNAEAAKYRHRLRDTEAERDRLAEQVTALRRAAVDQLVKAHQVPVDGFWASGVQLEDLLDEAGNLDDEKVKTAADTAVETLGLARAGTRMYVPSEGRVTNPSGSKSWESAFKAR